MAILCNKYDAVAGSSTGDAMGGGGCLTVENVCIALAVDTLQASGSHIVVFCNLNLMTSILQTQDRHVR